MLFCKINLTYVCSSFAQVLPRVNFCTISSSTRPRFFSSPRTHLSRENFLKRLLLMPSLWALFAICNCIGNYLSRWDKWKAVDLHASLETRVIHFYPCTFGLKFFLGFRFMVCEFLNHWTLTWQETFYLNEENCLKNKFNSRWWPPLPFPIAFFLAFGYFMFSLAPNEVHVFF